MKRLLIFGLLGSTLWAAGAGLVLDLVFNNFALPSAEALATIAINLPVAMPIGLFFAAVFGVLDLVLEKANLSTWHRVCASGAIAFFLVNYLYVPTSVAPLTFLSISLTGMLPAMMCSWLSGRREKGLNPTLAVMA